MLSCFTFTPPVELMFPKDGQMTYGLQFYTFWQFICQAKAGDLHANSYSGGLQISAECKVTDGHGGGDWNMDGMDLIFGVLGAVPGLGLMSDVMGGILG